MSVAALLVVVSTARAGGVLVLDVPGANDDCCAQKVVTLLEAQPFAAGVAADPATHRACVRLREGASVDEAALRGALASAGYPVQALARADACPDGLAPGAAREPWARFPDLDVKVVSRGEAFALRETRAASKYTVFDYGAPWCAPCFAVADSLAGYLRAHADSAVRVAWLDTPDARASFALPVAREHLSYATGLPWFVVLSPDGKKIYEGGEVAEATGAVDKHRARAKK
jgi:thiol-disulfide isomerase/thioredoxin